MELMFDCAIQDASHSEAIVCNNVKQADAEHIVKCVNEHDALVAEVERLKQELITQFELHLKANERISQAKEKAEAEVVKAKKLIDRILYAHKEGIIRISAGSTLTNIILEEAVEMLFAKAKKFITEKDGEG
jgi:cysteine sulfinate desulfinase/cysteine desulfurase-like protein